MLKGTTIYDVLCFFREETELFLELCDSNNHATIVSDCMNNYAKMDDYVKQALEGHDPLPDGEYNVIICREEDAKQENDRPMADWVSVGVSA